MDSYIVLILILIVFILYASSLGQDPIITAIICSASIASCWLAEKSSMESSVKEIKSSFLGAMDDLINTTSPDSNIEQNYKPGVGIEQYINSADAMKKFDTKDRYYIENGINSGTELDALPVQSVAVDTAKAIPKSQSTGELVFDTYTPFSLEQCGDGDSRIARRSKFQGQKSQASKIYRASQDRNTQEKYFQRELEEEENRRWWDNDNLMSQEDDNTFYERVRFQ
jgi:hypothetical protein